MVRYFYNVVIAIGKLINTIFGGNHNETLSSRLGKAGRGDYGRISKLFCAPFAWFVDVLFWPKDGWGHCRDNIEKNKD